MMKTFTLVLADNPVGADPVAKLYAAIAKAYPTLGYTTANSHIERLLPWPKKYGPQRTYLKLTKNDDPLSFEEFYYDRFDVTLYVTPTLFSSAERTALKDKTGLEVLKAISTKVKQNLTAQDFWVEPYQFTSTGGTAPPNFRLKAQASSPFWYNELIVQLKP